MGESRIKLSIQDHAHTRMQIVSHTTRKTLDRVVGRPDVLHEYYESGEDYSFEGQSIPFKTGLSALVVLALQTVTYSTMHVAL